ncbi:MAG: hypothetical protein NC215_00355 [Ruminococcus sp.]|nr:hypothetical protein [Ruminococcus sp.]
MINESGIKTLVGDIVDYCSAEECIKIARAVEILAFYNKNLLNESISDNHTTSKIIQEFLFEAEKKIRDEISERGDD